MLDAQAVTNLKCIVFGLNVQIIEASNYGIKCNNTLLNESLARGQFLLDLLNISSTVCKQLECEILAFNENKAIYCLQCDTPCIKEVITENV